MLGMITFEIPASCRECPLFVQGVKPYYCAGDTSYDHSYEHGDWLVNNYAASRPEWCPIQPIKEQMLYKDLHF